MGLSFERAITDYAFVDLWFEGVPSTSVTILVNKKQHQTTEGWGKLALHTSPTNESHTKFAHKLASLVAELMLF